jgi:hypothetical protein
MKVEEPWRGEGREKRGGKEEGVGGGFGGVGGVG